MSGSIHFAGTRFSRDETLAGGVCRCHYAGGVTRVLLLADLSAQPSGIACIDLAPADYQKLLFALRSAP